MTNTFVCDEHRSSMGTLIQNAVGESATRRKVDAALGGDWGDGGAARSLELLDYWLDGYRFAVEGCTFKYDHIVKQYQREADPDYQQYLALKEKFEGDKP